MLPIIQGRQPRQTMPLGDLFPADSWAVLAGGTLTRVGSVVTIDGGLRPTVATPTPPNMFPAWARPSNPQLLQLIVPATGVVCASMVLTLNGSVSLYRTTASASWAYCSQTWIAAT